MRWGIVKRVAKAIINITRRVNSPAPNDFADLPARLSSDKVARGQYNTGAKTTHVMHHWKLRKTARLTTA